MSQYVQQQTTPVPILKQINRVNDDGSYTYGYESADGTYKMETRDSEGNVRGKYAYVDETGEVKMVEYAAGEPTQTKGGFEARGAHVHKVPKSAPHDPSYVEEDVPEQAAKGQPRAKNLKVPALGHGFNSQPQHAQSPLSAFMAMDWQTPQHRFTAPKQRSMWDNSNTDAMDESPLWNAGH